MITMTNPVALIRGVQDGDDHYKGLFLWCPGCEYPDREYGNVGGLHLLPVSGIANKRAIWHWNKDLVNVSLEPSILTKFNRGGVPFVCHSFLRNGMWEFLGDCTHPLANKTVPMLPLPDWVIR